ncbi:hypothetical protein BDV28DRAFT_141565 [Aspergillus coremiiformis]|uniref:Uncharacterized protein n=1 Tax=Aspergillus coremiiformis TaxID=138285 RepID=A0A5N6YVW6_9EURO|nr:hypothetical protein BDV28DRAFT_141565 [Aspergillus coremiiformis]
MEEWEKGFETAKAEWKKKEEELEKKLNQWKQWGVSISLGYGDPSPDGQRPPYVTRTSSSRFVAHSQPPLPRALPAPGPALLPPLQTPRGYWQNSRNYLRRSVPQIPSGRTLDLTQGDDILPTDDVVTGPSYPPPHNGTQFGGPPPPTALIGYSQVGRLLPDTILSQDAAGDPYRENILPPIGGQIDGNPMPHGLPTIPYNPLPPLPNLGQALLYQYAEQDATQAYTDQPYDCGPTVPANIQEVAQVEPVPDYLYGVSQTEYVAPDVTQPIDENSELYDE